MANDTFTEKELLDPLTTVKAGKKVLIGEYTVLVGEEILLGVGAGGQDSATGRLFCELRDSAGLIQDGKMIIEYANPQGITKYPNVWSQITSILRSGKDDITKRVTFRQADISPQMIITENKKIQIWFMPDADGEISRDHSEIVMSIQRFDL